MTTNYLEDPRYREVDELLAPHNTHLSMEEEAIERLLSTRNRLALHYGYPRVSDRNPRRLLTDIVWLTVTHDQDWYKAE